MEIVYWALNILLKWVYDPMNFVVGSLPSTVITIAATIFAAWILWVGFVAIMHIRRVKQKYGLTKSIKVVGAPLLVFGYILDVGFNWIAGTAMFVDIPREKTFSNRLERYVKEDYGTIRRKVARYIREDLLADFDETGDHGTPGSSDNK